MEDKLTRESSEGFMSENIIELNSSSEKEKEKLRQSAIDAINNSHSFVMLYRKAACHHWKWMYSSMTDEDLMATGTLLQAQGVEKYYE